jgi:hypothetical protein
MVSGRIVKRAGARSLDKQHPRGGLMRVHPWCVVMTAALAFGGRLAPVEAQTTARKPAARPAAPRPSAPRPSEEERARQLAEGLASTVTMLEKTRAEHGFQRMADMSKDAWTGPYAQRLVECAPLVDEMLKAAQENRPADLARTAVKGHLVVDAVYDETTARTQQHKTTFMELFVKEPRDHDALEKVGRDMEVGTAFTSYVAATMDVFDFPIQIVLQHAPSAAQATAFAALADALPSVKPSRERLEGLLRQGYEQQADPAAKKEAATRMASLNVALKTPKADAPATKKAASSEAKRPPRR